MLQVQSFTFNPFQENTYLIYDETGEAVIIDPGCHTHSEQAHLRDEVEALQLKVVKLLNTHGHIDHMLGNDFVVMTWKVPFATHELVKQELQEALSWSSFTGIYPRPSPDPNELLLEGNLVNFGTTSLEVLFTPGHSAGHISFFSREDQMLFSGDVLFQRGIGRYDLPGGNYQILMQTIIEKILPLGDEVIVYPGHGSITVIGDEKQQNPFIEEYLSGIA